MAKHSILGVMTGKLGNMVGYKNTASTTNDKQAWRVYQPTVSNPRSVAQANQRMLLGPANKFYGALESVLSRSWQGIKYGADSRREFIKRALKRRNGPYVPKGTLIPVPADYQISDGSLVPITISHFSTEAAGYKGLAWSDLFAGSENDGTIGNLCANLINNNTDIQAGDQLTFVAVVAAAGTYIYRTQSFVIDPANTGYFPTRSQGGVLDFQVDEYMGDHVLVFGCDFDSNDEKLVAAAVIQSRDWDKASGGFRSPASLTIADDVIAEWFSDAAYTAAVASYTNGESASSDWPVENTEEIAEETAQTEARLVMLAVKAGEMRDGQLWTSPEEAVLARVVYVGSKNTPVNYLMYRTVNGVKLPLGNDGQLLNWKYVPTGGDGTAQNVTIDMIQLWATNNGTPVGAAQYYSKYGTVGV